LLPRAAEIGIDVDTVADVGDEQERRPAMSDRQRLGIAFGLPARLDHRLRPGWRAALGRAALEAGGGGLPENVEVGLALFGGLAVGIAALLGLQHEAMTFIGVDPAKAFGAVGFLLEHAALEHIIVMGVVGAAALGRINADQGAQAVHEALRVRKLGATGQRPF